MTQQLVDTEEVVIPDISDLVIEDYAPMDNFQSEKQQRLLVEPLYSSRVLPAPFIAAANVGVFYAIKQDPIVPDAFLPSSAWAFRCQLTGHRSKTALTLSGNLVKIQKSL